MTVLASANQNPLVVLSGNILDTPIPTCVKEAILKLFSETIKGIDTAEFELYFDYYSAQCRRMLGDCGRHTAARKHHDIVRIIQSIKELKDRTEMVDLLREELPNKNLTNREGMLEGSLNLAARLYLMMSFGDLPNATSPQRPLSWTKGSLQEFLMNHLSLVHVLSSETVKLPKLFNAKLIEDIGGIKIEWTSDLNQHLRMINDDKGVAVFHHASFLRLQQNSEVFPPGFINETLRTLALLFPQSDEELRQWVKDLPSNVDKSVRMCGHLGADARQIENFQYWHDRLVVLKQVFDEGEPGSLNMLWKDRRKRVQWYTVWTAVLVVLLTLFFGFIQCIEGAFQAYKAYHP